MESMLWLSMSFKDHSQKALNSAYPIHDWHSLVVSSRPWILGQLWNSERVYGLAWKWTQIQRDERIGTNSLLRISGKMEVGRLFNKFGSLSLVVESTLPDHKWDSHRFTSIFFLGIGMTWTQRRAWWFELQNSLWSEGDEGLGTN